MSPVARRFDLQLDGKGFMLARGEFRGRAYSRTGIPDTPSSRSSTDTKYGQVDDTLDHPEVWDDWSGGFGHAYRRGGANTYHWSEGFDARFPRQLVHCQMPQQAASFIASFVNANWIIDAPILFPSAQEGGGNVFLEGKGNLAVINPTVSGLGLTYSVNAGLTNYRFRPAIFGSFVYVGSDVGSFFYQINSVGSPVTGPSSGYSFLVAGNLLWRSHGPFPGGAFYLQNVAAPTGVMTLANWSATYNIGNYSHAIKDLIALEDQVFAGMNDGLYAGDSLGTFFNVMSELANQIHPDNCRDLTIYQGAVIVQHIAGVFAYKDGQVVDISPGIVIVKETSQVNITVQPPAPPSPDRRYIGPPVRV